jgi:ABC-type multidrug transport system ATPase subunit
MIELSGIKKRYGVHLALNIPQLTFLPGERYALIGPNGSGKTTLLRILAGTLKPDEGKVRFSGLDRGEIGYMPQKPYAFDLSVAKNVMLSLGGGNDARKNATAALERVGLANLAKARGSRLSGGETQRMALARLLAKPHKLLLLDEPTASADISASDMAEHALMEYAAETGCTLIFSSHAPSQALRLGTRAVALDGGQICEYGEAEDVLKNPKSECTKFFLSHWKL